MLLRSSELIVYFSPIQFVCYKGLMEQYGTYVPNYVMIGSAQDCHKKKWMKLMISQEILDLLMYLIVNSIIK